MYTEIWQRINSFKSQVLLIARPPPPNPMSQLLVVTSTYYKLHRKKGLAKFQFPAWMSLTKLALGGIIYFSRPERVWYMTSRLGTGISLTFFTVYIYTYIYTYTVPDSLEFIDGHSHVVVESVLEGNLHALLHLHAVKGLGQRYSPVY
jgi:hypothetical protein